MAERKAHRLEDKERTQDIEIEEDVDFGSMFLSDSVLGGLRAAGFQRPSPIQLAAIPLGRCGLDLVVQAKSGTGKTCVFTVVALEMVSVVAPTTQVLVLAPTREVAVQITQVLTSVASTMPGLKAATFIGGINLAQDKAKLRCCHVAVGTPGRVTQLVQMGLLKLDNVRLFVLDEADQLLSGQFTESVMQLAGAMPLNKQMLALSATYTEEVAKIAEGLMRSPSHVRLGRECPSLLGVGQFVFQLPYHHHFHRNHKSKFNQLLAILGTITFNQCLVFSNSQLRADSICNQLRASGWPAALLSGGQNQQDRLAALESLCSYRCRVLVSTDLAARGLDSEHVNLVVNMDLPRHQATYLHRVGRAGRFGSHGAAITLATEGEEWRTMRAVATLANVRVQILHDDWPATLAQKHSQDAEELVFLSEAEVAEWISLNSALTQQNSTDKKHRSPQQQDSSPHCKNGEVKEGSLSQKKHITSKRIDAKLTNGDINEEYESEDSEKENCDASYISDEAACKSSKVSNTSKSMSNRKKVKLPNRSTKRNEANHVVNEEVLKDTPEVCEEQTKPSIDISEEIKMQKEEDYNKVMKLLQGLNFSRPTGDMSYADKLKELSEKYSEGSTSDSPVIQIPPLPNKLEPSKEELMSLERYCKTIQEEMDKRADKMDKAWAESKVDVNAALQALIEGKDPEGLLEEEVAENRLLQETKSLEVSNETHRQTKLQPSGSRLYNESFSHNEARAQTSRKCSSKEKLQSKSHGSEKLRGGRSKQDSLDNQDDTEITGLPKWEPVVSKKDSKKKERVKPGTSDSEITGLPKWVPVVKKDSKKKSKTKQEASNSQDESQDYYYGDGGQYYSNQNPQWQQYPNTYWPEYNQYSQPIQEHYSNDQYHQDNNHNSTQAGCGNNQYPDEVNYQNYDQGNYWDGHQGSAQNGDASYQGNYWNIQNGDTNYQGNYWNGQQSSFHSGGSYGLQNAYVESACKFASMMEYVQTMGRMSAKMAHDFFSEKYGECKVDQDL